MGESQDHGTEHAGAYYHRRDPAKSQDPCPKGRYGRALTQTYMANADDLEI